MPKVNCIILTRKSSGIMEPEQEAAAVYLTTPIYKANHIRLGTFIGGPITAGYFIAHNYKVFGEIGKANAAWIYAIAATIVIFGGALLIPDAINIPNYIIPILYCWIAFYLTQYFQGSKIEAHVNSGARVFKWGRVVVIGLIGLAVTFIGLYVTLMVAADFS